MITNRTTLTLMLALMLAAVSAHAQTCPPTATVTFTGINDAVPAKFFNAQANPLNPADPTATRATASTLNIGLQTFKASKLPGFTPTATDTISFAINAPAGCVVATVTYFQTLNFAIIRNTHFYAITQLVVNGVASDVVVNTLAPDKSRQHMVDVTAAGAAVVPMSITTALVADVSDVRVTDARVVVTLADAPVAPPPGDDHKGDKGKKGDKADDKGD